MKEKKKALNTGAAYLERGTEGFVIVGERCGRDKNGNFRCYCGKCSDLQIRKDRNNCSNDCGNSSN